MFLTLKRYFFLIWTGCFIGSFAIIPFSQTVSILINGKPLEQTTFLLLCVAALEGLVYGILTFLGLKFSQKIGIHLLLLDKNANLKQDLLKPGIIVGIICTVLMLIADRLLPAAHLNLYYLATHMNPLYGLLGLIPAAFNEEVYMRLFLLSGIVILLKKFFKTLNLSTVMWVSILFTALLFGLGHIATFVHEITPATPLLILRIVILNGISGILFGLLFWKKGFETAMLAHLTSDFLLYVFIPVFI